MKKDGSLDKIINKWTNSSKTSSQVTSLTSTTSAGQKATPVKSKYVIASDSSFAPFVFQNSSNQYTGIDMDLIKAIAEDQGFEIEITNPGFDAAINAVQSGQADGMIAGMSVTDARKETFDTGDLMNNSLSTGAVNAIMDDKPVIEYAINQG